MDGHATLEPMSELGPGCVKTRLSQGRAELFSQLPSPNRSCQCNRFSTTTKSRRKFYAQVQRRSFHTAWTHCRSLRSGWSPSTFLKPFLTPAVPPYTSEQGLPYPARRYFVGPLLWCILRDLDDGAPICLVPFVLPKPFVPFGPFRHCLLKEASRAKSRNNLLGGALLASMCRLR